MVSEGTDRALKPELLHVSTEDYVLSRRLYMYLPERTLILMLSTFSVLQPAIRHSLW